MPCWINLHSEDAHGGKGRSLAGSDASCLTSSFPEAETGSLWLHFTTGKGYFDYAKITRTTDRKGLMKTSFLDRASLIDVS